MSKKAEIALKFSWLALFTWLALIFESSRSHYSFTLQILIEHLLCARHNAGLGFTAVNKWDSCLHKDNAIVADTANSRFETWFLGIGSGFLWRAWKAICFCPLLSPYPWFPWFPAPFFSCPFPFFFPLLGFSAFRNSPFSVRRVDGVLASTVQGLADILWLEPVGCVKLSSEGCD